jgi:hypothetical protein
MQISLMHKSRWFSEQTDVITWEDDDEMSCSWSYRTSIIVCNFGHSFRRAPAYAVNVLEGTSLRITNSTIEDTGYPNEATGIAFYSGAKLYADSTAFTHNYYGVEI